MKTQEPGNRVPAIQRGRGNPRMRGGEISQIETNYKIDNQERLFQRVN